MNQQIPITAIPWTPRAKKAILLSFKHAQKHGCDYISPVHFLVGILACGDPNVEKLFAAPVTLKELAIAASKWKFRPQAK